MKAKIRKLIVSVGRPGRRWQGGGAADVQGRRRRGHRESRPGQYVQDLKPLMDIGEELGDLLTRRCVAALHRRRQGESYARAAIVGERGELSTPPAILHPRWASPCGPY